MDWLLEQWPVLKSDLPSWLIEEAKQMQQKQAHDFATYVLGSIEQGLPPITFNDWINLEQK